MADNRIAEHNKLKVRAYFISAAKFIFNCNAFGDSDCVLHFTIVKPDILKLTYAITWPFFKVRTDRSGNRLEQVLVTFIVLL